MPKSFHEQLIKARKAAGLTQEKLADQLNISRQAVSRWERGNSQPDVEIIGQLAQLLNCEFSLDGNMVVKPQTAESNPAEKAIRKPLFSRSMLLIAGICFLAGALLMLLLVQFFAPFSSESTAGYSVRQPAGGVTGPETLAWFTQKEAPVPGRPYVEISFSESLCYPMPDPDFESGYGWNYTVYLTEHNGYDFYPETFEKYHFIDKSHSTHNVRTAENMAAWWGVSSIPARDQRCVTSGEPIQDIMGIGVKITGKDANGEYMEFYGYMECSQEIRE